MSTISRRSLLSLGLAATSVSLAGCSGSSTGGPLFGGLLDASGSRRSLSGRTISKPNYSVVYASYPGEPAPVKEFNYAQVDLAYLRQEVEYLGTEEPGTVVVDPASRHLYFVEAPGRATRYGVGVGREGFGWSGTAKINMRRSWPDWVPPKEMVARDPADPLATRGDVARAGRSRRSDKPARGEGDVSLRRRRRHGLSHPRYHGA